MIILKLFTTREIYLHHVGKILLSMPDSGMIWNKMQFWMTHGKNPSIPLHHKTSLQEPENCNDLVTQAICKLRHQMP